MLSREEVERVPSHTFRHVSPGIYSGTKLSFIVPSVVGVGGKILLLRPSGFAGRVENI